MTVNECLTSNGLRRTKNNISVLQYLWDHPRCVFRNAINDLGLRDSSFYDVIRRFNDKGIRY